MSQRGAGGTGTEVKPEEAQWAQGPEVSEEAQGAQGPEVSERSGRDAGDKGPGRVRSRRRRRGRGSRSNIPGKVLGTWAWTGCVSF